MRLGKDVLEADLYGALGVLPDATEAEIRVAYRRQVRTSHPDLNREDPGAAPRMLLLNAAARVLLDPALRRAYDRAPRGAERPAPARPSRRAAWYERRERSPDDDWAAPAPEPREPRRGFPGFFRELRGRDGQWSLQLRELQESLSARQQLSVAALLCALALGLLTAAQPKNVGGAQAQPTSVSPSALYP